jgi:hypothetical protein
MIIRPMSDHKPHAERHEQRPVLVSHPKKRFLIHLILSLPNPPILILFPRSYPLPTPSILISIPSHPKILTALPNPPDPPPMTNKSLPSVRIPPTSTRTSFTHYSPTSAALVLGIGGMLADDEVENARGARARAARERGETLMRGAEAESEELGTETQVAVMDRSWGRGNTRARASRDDSLDSCNGELQRRVGYKLIGAGVLGVVEASVERQSYLATFVPFGGIQYQRHQASGIRHQASPATVLALGS